MIKGFSGRSLGLKMLLVGILVLMLGVPLLFVNILAWERSARADEAAREIGRTEGGPQTIRGPFLLIPILSDESITQTTPDGPVTTTRTVERTLVVSAETLEVDAQLTTEVRRRAIYETPVYSARLRFSGQFAPGGLTGLQPAGARPDWSAARLVIAVSDLRGIGEDIALTLDGAATSNGFEPGSGFDLAPTRTSPGWAGVTAPIVLTPGRAVNFQAEFALSGAQSLTLIASGRETTARVTGDWAHPGFAGAYLPDTREIGDEGFSAVWRVPYLARGVPARWIEGAGFQVSDADQTGFTVNLISPTDGYVRVSRALKYALFFLGFTLLAVFLIEAGSKGRVHAAQYLLLGLAQVVFYLVLLALSEHASIRTAYLSASLATAGLTGLYAASAFRSWGKGMAIFAASAAVYALQYMLLIMEDYALLIGAGLAFGALALTMFVTRNVNWYNDGSRPSAAPTPAPRSAP
jgi:inner membrane protein